MMYMYMYSIYMYKALKGINVICYLTYIAVCGEDVSMCMYM